MKLQQQIAEIELEEKIFNNEIAKSYIKDAKKIVENNFKYENLEFVSETEAGYWYNLKGATTDNNYYGYNGCGTYIITTKDNKIKLEHTEYESRTSYLGIIERNVLTLTAEGSCTQLFFRKSNIEKIKKGDLK